MSKAKAESKPELEMKIDIRVLEHLGLKMYTSLPAVIAEYVANSWDAGATVVDINVPTDPISKKYAIIIQDNGFGMTTTEVQRKFLIVGRHRREDEDADEVVVNGRTRSIIGRKGLGKIAGFGVAGWVEILTRKDGQSIEFRMDYDKMQAKLSEENKAETKTSYKPEILRWGPTKKRNGTRVLLTRLKRKRAIGIESLRKSLARHFSVIGPDFIVRVNGKEISPDERKLDGQCEFVWRYDKEVIDKKRNLVVYGWIGTMEDTISQEENRGVVVMARGKLVQTPTTFDVGGKGFTGQFGLAYLVGEIQADFLDEEEDLISTGRRSVVWEMEPASSLRVWLNDAIRDVCADWVEKRRKKKMKVIAQMPVYSERILNLPKREKRIIDGFLGRMAGREDITNEAVTKVADFMASSVEYQTFLDFVESIEKAEVSKPEIIIEFFSEWEVLDAIEMVRLVEGRLEAITKVQEFVDTQAKEVPTLHNFLVDNPWLLDPSWDYLDDEVTYRKLILKKFPESQDVPEENRRIDFLCLGYGNTLHVIELKKPGSAIGRKQLDQLEAYVDFVRTLLGSDPKSYQSVMGYIVGGHISDRANLIPKIERIAAHGMYVRTFFDLVTITYRVHRRFIEILERKLKRIPDKRLEEGISRLKEKVEKKRVKAKTSS